MTEPVWPPAEMPASDDHLIALGAFSLLYNDAEMSLWVFFQRYIENGKARDYLFDTLNNRNRVNLIIAMASDDPDTEFKSALKEGLNCFDIVAENRNLALHAFPDLDADEHLSILKRQTKAFGKISRYRVPLVDIRASALASQEVSKFLFHLNGWLTDRDNLPAGSPPPALPKTPRKPRKLSLSALQEAHSSDQSPPESSAG